MLFLLLLEKYVNIIFGKCDKRYRKETSMEEQNN